MAERRMFARSVTGSARFLRLPASTRLLYYDLGMEADDDGCVEAFCVMRKTGATEDDLRVLVSRGFVRVLNEELVCYILDWNINNQIRNDRYHAGIYKPLIAGFCDNQLTTSWQPSDNQMATSWQPSGNQMTTNWQPSDNQMATEVSIGKDRKDNYRIEEERKGERSPRKFSPPSVEEVKSYCRTEGITLDAERFVNYYTSIGWHVGRQPMADWQAAARGWSRKEEPCGKVDTTPRWTVGTVV